MTPKILHRAWGQTAPASGRGKALRDLDIAKPTFVGSANRGWTTRDGGMTRRDSRDQRAAPPTTFSMIACRLSTNHCLSPTPPADGLRRAKWPLSLGARGRRRPASRRDLRALSTDQ